MCVIPNAIEIQITQKHLSFYVTNLVKKCEIWLGPIRCKGGFNMKYRRMAPSGSVMVSSLLLPASGTLPSSVFPTSFNLLSFKRQVYHQLKDQMAWFFFLLHFLNISSIYFHCLSFSFSYGIQTLVVCNHKRHRNTNNSKTPVVLQIYVTNLAKKCETGWDQHDIKVVSVWSRAPFPNPWVAGYNFKALSCTPTYLNSLSLSPPPPISQFLYINSYEICCCLTEIGYLSLLISICKENLYAKMENLEARIQSPSIFPGVAKALMCYDK